MDADQLKPVLSYAPSSLNRPQISKAALISPLIPLAAVPASSMLVEVLAPAMEWRYARGIGCIVLAALLLTGLTIGFATLSRIKQSSTRLRGRLLVLIGMTLDSLGLFLLAYFSVYPFS